MKVILLFILIFHCITLSAKTICKTNVNAGFDSMEPWVLTFEPAQNGGNISFTNPDPFENIIKPRGSYQFSETIIFNNNQLLLTSAKILSYPPANSAYLLDFQVFITIGNGQIQYMEAYGRDGHESDFTDCQSLN